MVSLNVVGIDYHSKTLEVCVLSGDGKLRRRRRCGNSVSEVAEFVSSLGDVKSVALEACGGAAEFADALREATGWETKLCHPGYVQRMRHNPDKTDKSDGELVADLNRVGYLPEVWLAPAAIRDLRTLVRYRDQLIQTRRNVKLRIGSVLLQQRIQRPSEHGLWTKKGMRWLEGLSELPPHTGWVFSNHLLELRRAEEDIKRCEERLLEIAKEDMLISKLLSIRGVGLVTACVMRAEVGTFSRFKTGKQLARFCGVTPRNASSGERVADAGMIKAGNPILKTALIQLSHVLRRHDPYWRGFAGRLQANGKAGSLVVAAVANRWLRKMFYELRRFEVCG